MDAPSTAVRIVLFERPGGAEGARAPGARDALTRIGADIELVAVETAEACVEAAAHPATDLVLLDRVDAAAWKALIDAIGEAGPPTVVVYEGPDELAVQAFRAGAADCVRADAESEGGLAVVALEQIQRHRPERERLRDRRRIATLERFSSSVVEHMGSGLLVLDGEAIVRYANPAAERILDVERGALEGRGLASLLGEGEALAWVRGVIGGGEGGAGRESLLRLPDGSRRPVGLSCAAMQAEAIGPRGAVLIIEDLSELKQLQRQVLQSEKMASIGQLAAGVAHEINNPTGFIHANLIQLSEYLGDLDRLWPAVDRLKKAVDEGDGGAAKDASAALHAIEQEIDLEFLRDDLGQAVRESQEGAERIRHIVQDLRDFSHQDTGALDSADLNACVDSTAHIVWTMMRHSALLEKDYGDLPPVRCYPMQLKQVFMNLLVNAYQAIEARADTSRAGLIRIETRAGDAGVVVRIADTGVGIEQSHVDRIFDPFFTTKEPGEGTGLGLSLSYAIVERHGGTMHVESRVGEGTTFEIELPWEAPEQVSAGD